jgi:hypothetical protein
MGRRRAIAALALALTAAAATATHAAVLKWPPWLSIETPVNPFDADARGAVLLVHAAVREGRTSASDLAGSAEGIVRGARRSVPLRFDATSRPDVYAVRRQWPAEGSWVLRITLLRNTTALVTLDPSGNVASARVPTRTADGMPLPRPVAAREIDSLLTLAARCAPRSRSARVTLACPSPPAPRTVPP